MLTQHCTVGDMPFQVTPSADNKRLQTSLPYDHAGSAMQNCTLAVSHEDMHELYFVRLESQVQELPIGLDLGNSDTTPFCGLCTT